MTTVLPPYPTYKDSGVPWLGEIPGQWEVLPLFAVAQVKSITGKANHELLSVYLDKGVIRFSDVDEKRTNVTSEDLSKYQSVDPGDFVLNNQQAWRGSVGVSKYVGIVSPAYLVLSLNARIAPLYANLLFRDKCMVDQYLINSRGVGTIQRNLYWPGLKRVRLVVPPLPEQHAITRYLDHMDRRIRRTIRAKQRLIALLEEQKQAIIHQAVTRGLDPTVRLKPSGVAWLRDVPEHWDVLRSKYLFREIDTRSLDGDETRLSMSQKFGLIPSTEIEEKRLLSESSVGGKLCERGDLVLNRLKAHLGVFALASQLGIVSPDYTVFRPRSEMVPQYFEAVYRTPACRVELRQRAKGIVEGFWRLYTDDFYDIRVPVPPVSEQSEIIERLDIELSDLARAIDRTQREIALLREYRTRLIADVVTGQVDVRAAAAQLPEEAEEMDALAEVEVIEDEEDEGLVDEDEELDA